LCPDFPLRPKRWRDDRLDREGAGYTIENISAKTGKNAAYIAKRIRLLDLIPPVGAAFIAGHIGIEHRPVHPSWLDPTKQLNH
jgi:hypothetical protein